MHRAFYPQADPRIGSTSLTTGREDDDTRASRLEPQTFLLPFWVNTGVYYGKIQAA
jgi:hypothetical protein